MRRRGGADRGWGVAVTLHDVARRAGVSIKTVSNVVREHPNVRDATRERVRAAIAELGYRPNLSARTLRSGRSGVLGLALPDLALPYFAELAADVIRAAEARGRVVLIEQTGGERSREVDVLSSARLQMVDGLLFSPLALDAADRDLLRIDTPVVLLGEHLFDPATDHVTMRNEEAACAATHALLAAGRRRVAAVGVHSGEVVGTAGLRLAGYRRALAEAGVPEDPALLVPAGMWHRRQGAEAVAGLLARRTAFDAVFAFNDTLALGALRSLDEAGLRVPEDVALIGFDDSDDGQYSRPQLSTVDAGRREIAERAVALLVERIEDRSVPVQRVEVDFRLVERASTRRALVVAGAR